MARFRRTVFAVWLPLCASTRGDVEASESLGRENDLCSVEEVPTHHQFGISFAYTMPGGCSTVNCNNHYFFRDGKSDKGLADFIVTKKEGLTCHCSVSGKYSEDGQDRELITYHGGEGVRQANECTAHTCWEHYASLRYFIDHKTRAEAANLESPGSNNHWISECKDSSTKSSGVTIQSVRHLVQQLEKDGHQDVVKAAAHLFVNLDKPEKVFARGFKVDDHVWWNSTGLRVSGTEDIVKYGTDGKIVDGEVSDKFVTVKFSNNAASIVVPAHSLSRVALDKCVEGFCVDDIVYYTGDDMLEADGSSLLMWSSAGVVIAPTSKLDDEIKQLLVKFGTMTTSVDVRLLSKSEPVEQLPGDLKRGQPVYYKGESLHVVGRSPVTYGVQGVVAGPSKTIPEEDVEVTFDDTRVSVPGWTLSSVPLATSFSNDLGLGDTVYYTGSNQHFACDSDLAYGQKGVVVGGSDRPELVSVRFDGLTFKTEIRTDLVAKEPPPMVLPMGLLLGDCVYLKEDVTIPGGGKIFSGHKGRIAKAYIDTSRVVVKFDGLTYLVNLAVDKVQEEPLTGVLNQRAWTVNVLPDVQKEVKYVGRQVG